MKVFLIALTVTLVGALALSLVVKGSASNSASSNNQTVGGVTSVPFSDEPMEMYRWQDEHGVWQFGELPPEEAVATKLAVDASRTTPMGSDWNVAVPTDQSAGINPVNFKMPNSLTDAYRAAPELMDAAKRAADAMNARNQEIDSLLHQSDAGSDR